MRKFEKTAICLLFLFLLCFYPHIMAGHVEGEDQAKVEAGKLEIWFRISPKPMTERDIYYHVCKLYIDDKEMEDRPFVNKENKWFRIFSIEPEEGIHNVKVVHGYASSKGKWAGEFGMQPKIFRVEIEKGPAAVIKYSYNIGWANDEYIYDKLPPSPPVSRQPIKLSDKHKPRIMVVIPEQHLQRQRIPDPAAETEIIRKFVENDFWVVDQIQVREIRYNDEAKQALQGNNDTAAAIGRQFDAEVLIIGEAFCQITDFTPSLVQCSARVEARVIKVDTGQILATHAFTAVAHNISEEIAAKESLARAGGKMGEYLVEEVARKWESISPAAVRVKLTGVDFRQLIMFEQMLDQQIKTAKQFHRRSFDIIGKVAEIDVDVEGGAQSLSTELTTRAALDFEVEVLSFTTNSLDLKLKQKADALGRLAISPRGLIFIEHENADGSGKEKHKIMVLRVDDTRLEYNWSMESPDGGSRSGTYMIDEFSKSHDYSVYWEAREENPPSGTAPWISREAFRELRDNGFTAITIDKHIRKDSIVIAELKGVTTFSAKVNGKEAQLQVIDVHTDKGDKLLILDELQNPLVLSADVAGRYRSKVTAIYIPGYVQPHE